MLPSSQKLNVISSESDLILASINAVDAALTAIAKESGALQTCDW